MVNPSASLIQLGGFVVFPPPKFMLKYTGLHGTCVMLLLCFYHPWRPSYPSTRHPDPHLPLSTSVPLTRSLSANGGCIYLFYLGMSDS